MWMRMRVRARVRARAMARMKGTRVVNLAGEHDGGNGARFGQNKVCGTSNLLQGRRGTRGLETWRFSQGDVKKFRDRTMIKG